ncbi:hypothetical protein BP5796_05500 [Coleophoma crateriformis]|uniref:Uncharacterized protein n=1 Tax=Coleophoma crateriformis TaxID=565419 RepID=A0A3D8S3D2_9HELO|nr:hypothetical protein BP5796_05500 [Coleophoma crateriformis]
MHCIESRPVGVRAQPAGSFHGVCAPSSLVHLISPLPSGDPVPAPTHLRHVCRVSDRAVFQHGLFGNVSWTGADHFALDFPTADDQYSSASSAPAAFDCICCNLLTNLFNLQPTVLAQYCMSLHLCSFHYPEHSDRFGSLKLVQIDLQQPARLQVGQRLNISVYAIFFGIASFTTALLAAYLFEINSPNAMSDAEINRLGLHLVGAGASGLLGARLPVFSRPGALHELLRLQKLTQCGLWLQGSISAVALSVLFLPVATDRYQLLLSLVLAFPLGEALGRLGCHFAGCCMTGHRPEKMTTPLQSALFNSAIGATLLALHFTHRVPLLPAAALALALNALVRLALRPNVFAAAQLLLGLVSIGHSIPSNAAMVDHPQSIFNGAGHSDGHGMPSLRSPWVAVLAFASLLSGVFVQLCSVNSPRVNIIMNGDAAMKASSSVPALEGAQSSPISRARESLSCPGKSVELVVSGGEQPQ